MLKKFAVPAALAISVTLAGCSSGDVSSLEAEIELLRQEVNELKVKVEGGAVVQTNASSASSEPADTAKASYKIGENVVYKGVTFTITENSRVPSLKEGIKADDGYEFILFDVEINNTSNDDYRFSQNDYSVVLSNGEIKDNYLLLDFNNELDDLGSGNLAAGGIKNGWVAFQIPKGEQLQEFRYSKRSINGTDTFKVSLN